MFIDSKLAKLLHNNSITTDIIYEVIHMNGNKILALYHTLAYYLPLSYSQSLFGLWAILKQNHMQNVPYGHTLFQVSQHLLDSLF